MEQTESNKIDGPVSTILFGVETKSSSRTYNRTSFIVGSQSPYRELQVIIWVHRVQWNYVTFVVTKDIPDLKCASLCFSSIPLRCVTLQQTARHKLCQQSPAFQSVPLNSHAACQPWIGPVQFSPVVCYRRHLRLPPPCFLKCSLLVFSLFWTCLWLQAPRRQNQKQQQATK